MGGKETRVGHFILLGRISSSAGRLFAFGTFDGRFITLGTFVALEGVSSSMAGNRGLSDALVGSGAVALVEPGSTMPAATSAPTIAATAVIKPAMAVSTPGNVVQNPTAGFSSPMDQTPLCAATPTGEPDETSASIAYPGRPVWGVNPPDGQLTRRDQTSGRRRQMVDVDHRCSRVRWGCSGHRTSSIADRAFPRTRRMSATAPAPSLPGDAREWVSAEPMRTGTAFAARRYQPGPARRRRGCRHTASASIGGRRCRSDRELSWPAMRSTPSRAGSPR